MPEEKKKRERIKPIILWKGVKENSWGISLTAEKGREALAVFTDIDINTVCTFGVGGGHAQSVDRSKAPIEVAFTGPFSDFALFPFPSMISIYAAICASQPLVFLQQRTTLRSTQNGNDDTWLCAFKALDSYFDDLKKRKALLIGIKAIRLQHGCAPYFPAIIFHSPVFQVLAFRRNLNLERTSRRSKQIPSNGSMCRRRPAATRQDPEAVTASA